MKVDHQEYSDRCQHCLATFSVTRGSAFQGEDGVAIYLAAMHACDRRLVDLAIGVRQGFNGAKETSAVFIKVNPADDEIQMTLIDPKDSFWQTEDYLGRPLSRDEALASPLIGSFFHIADHIVTEVPALIEYLASPTS